MLLDILIPNTKFVATSLTALERAESAGFLVLSEPVYAELAAVFADQAALDQFLGATRLTLVPSGAAALDKAGRTWSRYRARRPAGLTCPHCGTVQTVVCVACGTEIATRQHVVADFLIGAHAAVHADVLLTRDRGFYATYFPELALGG